MKTAPQYWRALGTASALALLLQACGGGGSSGTAVTPPVTPPVAPPVAPPVTPPVVSDGSFTDSNSYSSARTASLATPNENAAVVKSSMTLAGQKIDYTATSGHLTATDLSGKPIASFFYTAYTADNKAAATRPLTFLFNGGPGSASMWLHMGAFAPKRIVTNIPSSVMPSPTQLVENQESLLDITDMVFIDPVGTGFSQAVAPNINGDFWGVDSDAASMRDFVRRYLAANNRSVSPLYLLGESYGGPRAAVMANLLESAGVKLTGVIVQSPAMNYNSNCGILETPLSCEGYVPTYAAIGAYHKVSNPVPTDFGSYVVQARAFAAGAYRTAMSAFISSKIGPPVAVADQLAAYTGIGPLTWQQTFNLMPWVFQQTVLPGQLVGRYDARVAAANGSALTNGGDPSMSVISNVFVNAMFGYLNNELKYKAGSAYVPSGNVINEWNFSHDGKIVPDSIPDLASAILINPKLKVMSMSGMHDLATPFYQTELDFARLGNNPNLTIRNYSGGHMSYLDDTARKAQRVDLLTFYASTGGSPQ
jgi:carboxypeptidase C (cathepsin A)